MRNWVKTFWLSALFRTGDSARARRLLTSNLHGCSLFQLEHVIVRTAHRITFETNPET